MLVKWAEGVCGAVAGVLGIVALAIIVWLGPTYAPRQVCEGPIHPVCYTPVEPPEMTIGPSATSPFDMLIPLGVVFALFVGVLIGTWLDLHGRRPAGRLILLLSAISLLLASVSILPSALYFEDHGGPLPDASFVLIPFDLLALITFVLACIRRDAPHPTTSPSAQP